MKAGVDGFASETGGREFIDRKVSKVLIAARNGDESHHLLGGGVRLELDLFPDPLGALDGNGLLGELVP